MKFVPIFDTDNLFAVQFEGEGQNIYDTLIEQWNDPIYITEFLKKHEIQVKANHETIESIRFIIDRDAEGIDDTLYELSQQENANFDDFFKPLNNNEYHEVYLQPQKGRKNYLRIYAVKIESNMYLITGGAIKLTHRMQDAEHTKKELSKLNRVRDYLKENGVDDNETFYSLLIESEHDE